MKIYEVIQQQRPISCQRDCLQRGYHHQGYFSKGNNENCEKYHPSQPIRTEEPSPLEVTN